MKTKTWWHVTKCGTLVSNVAAVAWTDTTITYTDPTFLSEYRFYKTTPIRSIDGPNYFQTEKEAIDHSHQTVAKLATESRTWA